MKKREKGRKGEGEGFLTDELIIKEKGKKNTETEPHSGKKKERGEKNRLG